MSNEKNIKSNQFPIIQKKVRCKHDFKIKNGYVYFNYFYEQKKFTGFEFINWLKINHFEYYFEYIIYKWYGYNTIKVYTDPLQKISCKNTKTKEVTFLNKFPDISNPKILGIKPKINNPIRFLEQLEFDSRKKEQENIMKEIEQDNIKYGYVTDDNEELNEGKVFKKGVLALMAFFLSMGIQKTYAQCSGDLQAAMKNPNDPKNAKILSGAGTDIDKKINIENGFGNTYKMMSKDDEIAYKKQLEDEKKSNKEYDRNISKQFKRKFNSDLNIQDETLSKPEKKKFQENFNNFIKDNPNFKIDPSRYNAIERYAFLTKVLQEQSVIRKLNVMFGRPNPYDNTRMTIDELYKYIQDKKINGFDSFTEMYKTGFSDVSFPDNPHKNESKILGYNDYINENWFKKAVLAGALATSALSGHSQQKIDKFAEYQTPQTIEHSFKSPDEVNKWLRSSLDTNYKWEIIKTSVEGGNDLTIKISVEKSNDGYNKIAFTCNKVGIKEEDKSKTHVLEKNPGSELINSGKTFILNKIQYEWYLIGVSKGKNVKYTDVVTKSDDKKNDTKSEIHKPDVKKGLIDAQAYAAIYKFETTKGRIVKSSDGKYKATTMETNDTKYNVHQKDKVIKDHIESSIGLDTWFKIPPKFRMQIFSYMFNSDSYEDAKGDRFRWLAGLAQSLNPNKFADRKATMANPKEAIEFIKGLEEKDFTEHYKDYLDVLHTQYASLSTSNGYAYDNAAKELSWFARPGDLDKYY